MVRTIDARVAWRALNGLCCIYKPAGSTINRVRDTVISNLIKDLNSMHVRPMRDRVQITGATNLPMKVEVVPDLADHVLVTGPRYQHQDIKINYGKGLGVDTSGILRINEGTKLTYKINQSRPTRAFKVHGIMGAATETCFIHSKVVEKTTFGHVTRERMDKVVAYMQSMHQKKMYELSGVDIQSQTAYDMAVSGFIRPLDTNVPVIYAMKCVYFKPPHFTIEIQSVNESEKYLHTLMHEIGRQIRSSAHCSGVQCIRHGRFTLEQALLSKHWTLQHILDSMKTSEDLLMRHKELLHQTSAVLT